MTSLWQRLMLGIVAGGLSVLCLHPGSRPFLHRAWFAEEAPLRSTFALPEPDNLEADTLWAERSALVPAHTRDEILLRLEVDQAAQQMEPLNRFWTLQIAQTQQLLGNRDQVSIELDKAKSQPDNIDHRDLAMTYQLKPAGRGAVAWRAIALADSWPFEYRPTSTSETFASLTVATLPGSLLLTTAVCFVMAGLADLLLRFGRLQRIAGSPWIYVVAFVVSVGWFLFTRMLFAGLSLTILIGAFGATQDRIIHHSRASASVNWAYYVLGSGVAFFLTAWFVLTSSPCMIMESSGVVPYGAFDSERAFAGVGFASGLFIALAHVVAYIERREPVYEFLFQIRRVSYALALVAATMALFATPLCMAVDRTMAARVTNWTRSQP